MNPHITYTIELQPPRTGKELSEIVREVAAKLDGKYHHKLYSVTEDKRSYELGIMTSDHFGDVVFYGDSCLMNLEKQYRRLSIHSYNFGDSREYDEAEIEKMIAQVERVKAEVEEKLR
ncbi:MAG TPA: hypothetical protein VJA23_02245 [Candidatus Nanoarchaeia archaeon]|nr:hypothetical protein [Candidatus Nanoarchaeia archaeon]